MNLHGSRLSEEFITTFLACTKEDNKRFKVAEWDTIEVEAQHEQLRKPPFARKFLCVKMYGDEKIEKQREQLRKLAFVEAFAECRTPADLGGGGIFEQRFYKDFYSITMRTIEMPE